MVQTEWSNRWRRLAAQDLMTGNVGEGQMVERWRELARRLDSGVEQRRDPILDFVLERLSPGMTVLDIGAGVGRWTIPLAEAARSVTAVEPVPGMQDVLRERLAGHGTGNVEVVAQSWLEAEVEPHDFAVAAYSMYTSPDLVAFAEKMEAQATRFCGLAMRLPAADGIIGELSERVHGDWHDSTNFIVGYNALLEAGFAPNVFIERAPVSYWTDDSLEGAVIRARRHLRLETREHDALIEETLRKRLTPSGEGYRWPDWMRAALVWWEPER